MARQAWPALLSGPSWKGEWGWPLTVGFFPGPDAVQLIDLASSRGAFKRGLAKAVLLGPEARRCDILVVDRGFGQIDGDPGGVRAGAALVLLEPSDEKLTAGTLRKLAQWEIGALSLMRLDTDDVSNFLHSLVYELSHDLRYDEAVDRAAAEAAMRSGRPPDEVVTLQRPGFSERAQLRQVLDRSVDRLNKLPRTRTVHVPSETVNSFGLGRLDRSRGVRGKSLGNAIATNRGFVRFDRESDGATGMARLEAAIKDAASGPKERFPDAILYRSADDGPGDKLGPDEPIEPGIPYVLEFALRSQRIGIGFDTPVRPTAISASKDVELLVAVSPGPECEIEFIDSVQSIRLPVTGDSAPALFGFTVAKAGATASIDIRVYYRFNLLEHVRVEASVAGTPGRVIQRVEQLSQFQAYSGDLGATRPPVDLSLDVRREGAHVALAVASREKAGLGLKVALPISMADLTAELDRLRSLWIDVALGPFGAGLAPSSAPDGRKALLDLATAGSRLWGLLFDRGYKGGAASVLGAALRSNPLPPGATVQVNVPDAAHAFAFPWALLYDRDLPTPPEQVDVQGFWGARYVIEQRPTGRGPMRKPQGAKPGPVALFVNSTIKQTKDHVTNVVQLAANGSRLAVKAAPIETATEFKADLKLGDSQLLYFFCHAVTAFPNALVKELQRQAAKASRTNGNYGWLSKGHLGEDDSSLRLTKAKVELSDLWLCDGQYQEQPIVILNMCESAQVMPELSNSFVHFFLSRLAGAVLGTECPVPPQLAAHVGEAVMARLSQGRPVGEALLEVRQGLLLDHRNPLGLAYTLWGASKRVF